MNKMYAMIEPNTNKLLGWYKKDIHRQVIAEDLILESKDKDVNLLESSTDAIVKLVDDFLIESNIKYDEYSIKDVRVNSVLVGTKVFKLTFDIDKCIGVDIDVWQEAINNHVNCYENGKFIVKDFRTDVEIEKERIASIKAKAGEIITSKYDIIKQMNIYGEGGDKQIEMVSWIKKIRDISNKAEADGTALEDINWEL
jgi:hypothetical protein